MTSCSTKGSFEVLELCFQLARLSSNTSWSTSTQARSRWLHNISLKSMLLTSWFTSVSFIDSAVIFKLSIICAESWLIDFCIECDNSSSISVRKIVLDIKKACPIFLQLFGVQELRVSQGQRDYRLGTFFWTSSSTTPRWFRWWAWPTSTTSRTCSSWAWTSCRETSRPLARGTRLSPGRMMTSQV